jgi:hypothetical protein
VRVSSNPPHRHLRCFHTHGVLTPPATQMTEASHFEVIKETVRIYNAASDLATKSEEAAITYLEARNNSIMTGLPAAVGLGRGLLDAKGWYDTYKTLQSTPVRDTFLDNVKQKVGWLKYSPAQQAHASALDSLRAEGALNAVNMAVNIGFVAASAVSTVNSHLEAKRWDKGELCVKSMLGVSLLMMPMLYTCSLRSPC